jgi:hypothetical protein
MRRLAGLRLVGHKMTGHKLIGRQLVERQLFERQLVERQLIGCKLPACKLTGRRYAESKLAERLKKLPHSASKSKRQVSCCNASRGAASTDLGIFQGALNACKLTVKAVA